MKNNTNTYQKELIHLLTRIKHPELMRDFLLDLLSPAEYQELILRLQIIIRLAKNETQRNIAKSLGVSISKVTRGARELNNPGGGFKKILDKYYLHELNKDWWQKFS